MSLRSVFVLSLLVIFIYSCSEDNPSGPPTSNIKAELTEIARTDYRCNMGSFSPDGKYFVGTVSQFWVSYSYIDPEGVYLFDIENNKMVREFYLREAGWDEFDCAVISPDGKYVAAGGTVYNGWFGVGVVIWDIETGKMKRYNNDFPGWAEYLRYSPGGDTLFVYTSEQRICTWNLETNQVKVLNEDFLIFEKQYFQLSPDCRYALFSDSGELVDLSQDPAVTLVESFARACAYLPDYKRAIVVTNNEVGIFDFDQGKRVKLFSDHYTKYHHKVAVSPSGKFFATYYDVGEDEYSMTEWGIQIWETGTLCQIGKIDYRDVKYLEFGKDETILLAASDQNARVYKIDYIAE